MRSAARWFGVIAVVALTVGCDQVTKSAARHSLAGGAERELLGGALTLTLAENRGGFLSLGSRLPVPLRLALGSAAVAALLGVVVTIVRDRSSSRAALLGAGLLLAGGVGNHVDRIVWRGGVTDFLLLRWGALHTGVFNLADLAIMAGALVLLVASARARHA